MAYMELLQRKRREHIAVLSATDSQYDSLAALREAMRADNEERLRALFPHWFEPASQPVEK